MIETGTFHKERLARLSVALRSSPFDAIVLNPSPGLVYVSDLHFHVSERPVVLVVSENGKPGIVLPELEAAKAGRAPFDIEPYTYSEDPDTWQPAFDRVMESLPDDARVGLAPQDLRVLELQFLERARPSVRFESAATLLSDLRIRKDAGEVESMEEAVRIAEAALGETLPRVAAGATEREVNGLLVENLLRNGSSGDLPFQPIVAFGANSADPHAVSSDYAARDGDLLLFDWGANVDGYFSDLTRTFALGEPDEELRGIHDAVHAANLAAMEAAGPGVPASDVDRAARAVIEDAGYGDRFIHRTGHGLGLEIHEAPFIRADNERRLEPGMTFTVEPGIYLPGRGGVRIEDDVLITEDGARCLSSIPRELRILPV